MRRLLAAAAALALLAAAAPAVAQERLAGLGSFEFQMSQYLPMIDSEFAVPSTKPLPWATAFGTSRRLVFKFHGGKAVVHGYGTLEVGGGIGYMNAQGHGVVAAGALQGQPSAEKTTFRLVPLSLDLTYRADMVWEKFSVPVVPYARLALIRDQWWVTGSGGKKSMSGATNGWSWGGGLGLVLDFIDTTLARELERDSGIKHTMLVFEVAQTRVKDFGSKNSWDLSNDGPQLSFGLLFAF
jgi:hypothetical protein